MRTLSKGETHAEVELLRGGTGFSHRQVRVFRPLVRVSLSFQLSADTGFPSH